MTRGQHAESLLRVPLVRHMLEDRGVELVARAVDARWEYEGIVPARLGGFNPLEGAVYYPARSFLARWLRDPTGSARRHNENDFLVREVLFAVHDYLHVWAYRALDSLVPARVLAERPLARSDIEDMVFIHLVSEAAATVGLDYWFLCTVSLNAICDIGTRMDFGLTTDYHERFAGEYRRYAPLLRVQSPEFFVLLTDFYCSGVFQGFDVRALRESPLVLRWLEHELRYSRLQRRYARQWFSYLSPDGLAVAEGELDAPLALDQDWKQRAIAGLATLLWDKVKNDTKHAFSPRPKRHPWRSPLDKPVDFRFVNLNWFASPEAARRASTSRDPASERHRLFQTIGHVDFAACSAALRSVILPLARDSAFEALAELLRDKRRIGRRKGEPRDLFLLA
jgi:hypothetical protein